MKYMIMLELDKESGEITILHDLYRKKDNSLAIRSFNYVKGLKMSLKNFVKGAFPKRNDTTITYTKIGYIEDKTVYLYENLKQSFIDANYGTDVKELDFEEYRAKRIIPFLKSGMYLITLNDVMV